MRIAIQTLGTRGDVQPYIALARALMARGHDVQIALPVQFEDFAHRHGVAAVPLPGEFLALMDTPEGKAAIAGGQGFGAGFKLLKHVRPLMRRLLDLEWHAIRGFQADAIVFHPKSIASPHVAERLWVPAILASPLPGFTPTAEFPTPLLPFGSLGPLNRASHALAIRGADMLFSKLIRDWRVASLGLPARRIGRFTPAATLYAYSPEVVPRPADWNGSVLVTGYWFLDDPDWQPAPALRAFLDRGEPPVYVGFGSMPGLDPRATAALVIDALARTGKRGLLASGGGALAASDIPETIHLIAEAPHDRILPSAIAAIHHGGAGTTGAALRAGIPMAICPFFGDQPFWARRIAALGAGPPPLERKSLSAGGLVQAIAALSAAPMRARAGALGAAIRRETGVADAVAHIERTVFAKAA